MPQSYTFSLEKQSRDENFIPQDAPFLTIGERNGIGDSSEYPDLDKGLHFCLFNNLWSTDFHLWQEGSIRYGFHIEGGQ